MLRVTEFVERDLGFKLFPVQKFFLRMAYGEALDTKEKFKVPRSWHLDSFYDMTEAEYLQFLYNEGRCNASEPDPSLRDVFLAGGRLGSKSTLSAILSAYETYKLIQKDNPQKYYGMLEGTTIDVLSVSTDKDQAGMVYQEASLLLSRSGYTRPYRALSTLSYTRFQSPADVRRYGFFQGQEAGSKATLRMTFRSCIAKGLRGPNCAAVILDEMAHFCDEGQGSAEAVYDAVTPSIANFTPKDPTDPRIVIGPRESSLFVLSTPLIAVQGDEPDFFCSSYSSSFKSGGCLCLQIPTWELNPAIPVGVYQKAFERNLATFEAEFGARFVTREKVVTPSSGISRIKVLVLRSGVETWLQLEGLQETDVIPLKIDGTPFIAMTRTGDN